MQKALTEAQRTIAVLSPDYLTSNFTAPEWAVVFAGDPTGAQGVLVPVRVRECDVPGLLKPIIYIDLVSKNEAAAQTELLDGLKHGRVKPLTPPVICIFPAALPPVRTKSAPDSSTPPFNVSRLCVPKNGLSESNFLSAGDWSAESSASGSTGGI